MANLALKLSIPKFHHLGAIVVRSPWSSRVFITVRPGHIHASTSQEATAACGSAAEAIKEGATEAKKVGQDVKDKAVSATEDVTQKTKDVAGKVSETAQDLTEKAKQTVEDAWGSVKDTTQKVKDTVVGKAEESKESIKENAETVKRSMNMKN